MSRCRSRWLVAVATSLALAASACGDDDDADGADPLAEEPSDTASSAPEPSAEDASTEEPSAEEPSAEESSAEDASAEDASADDGGADGEASDAGGGSAAAPVGCDAVDLSAVPSEPVNIRFGHGAGTEEPLYLLAIDPEGAGSQHNGTHYTVELTEYTPPDRLAAYQAGAMDAGTISVPQLITAVGRGLNIMAATSIAIVSEEGGFVFPYAAVEGTYAPGDDLTGAVIGIIAPNTSTEYWAKAAIAAMGLDPDRDVSYMPVPVPNSEQALRDGQVDIQFFTSSFWGRAQAAGGLVVVFDALDGPGFDHELLDVFFDRDFVEDNPVAYCAWRADYAASMAAFTSDRAGFAEVLIAEGYDPAPTAEAFASRPDAGRSGDAAIDVANVQALMDNMFEIGFLPEDLEVSAEDLVMEGFSLTK